MVNLWFCTPCRYLSAIPNIYEQHLFRTAEICASYMARQSLYMFLHTLSNRNHFSFSSQPDLSLSANNWCSCSSTSKLSPSEILCQINELLAFVYITFAQKRDFAYPQICLLSPNKCISINIYVFIYIRININN